MLFPLPSDDNIRQNIAAINWRLFGPNIKLFVQFWDSVVRLSILHKKLHYQAKKQINTSTVSGERQIPKLNEPTVNMSMNTAEKDQPKQ